jgi:hypothetical protein
MANRPLNFYDLVETLPQSGCVICTLVERDTAHFLDSQLYEYVNESETHAALRASRGLCAVHSAQLVDYGAQVLGIAILHAAILDELLKQAAAPRIISSRLGLLRGNEETVAGRLEPSGRCMACEAMERAEQRHIQTLAGYIHEAKMKAAFEQSEGLCLPHFRLALEAAPDASRHDLLLQIQLEKWRSLKAELEMFVEKYDINHADRSMGAEADSWRRALRLVSGAARIFGVRRGR